MKNAGSVVLFCSFKNRDYGSCRGAFYSASNLSTVHLDPFIDDTEKVLAGQLADQAAYGHAVCSYNRGDLLVRVIMA